MTLVEIFNKCWCFADHEVQVDDTTVPMPKTPKNVPRIKSNPNFAEAVPADAQNSTQDDENEMSDIKLIQIFENVLSDGVHLSLHLRGGRTVTTTIVLTNGVLSWKYNNVTQESKSVPLSDIVRIQTGKSTEVLIHHPRTMLIREDRCLSLINVSGESYDFEASSSDERDALVQGFGLVLNNAQSKP